MAKAISKAQDPKPALDIMRISTTVRNNMGQAEQAVSAGKEEYFQYNRQKNKGYQEEEMPKAPNFYG